MRLVLIVAIAAVAGVASAQDAEEPALFPQDYPDLLDDVPDDFPRFHFSCSEEDAQWLSRYLWRHFSHRGGAHKGLFNQEYVTTSDLWMNGAIHPRIGGPIQDIHKRNLQEIQLDPEGYVWTHQHFSHAHDHGWPFPMWTQAPAGEKGYGAGWHFEESGTGWVWQHFLDHQPESPFGRAKALEGWGLTNLESHGIVDGNWKLTATGPSPTMEIPDYVTIDAFNAPFLQLRWTRTPAPPEGVLPYIEWKREGDGEYSPERRVEFGFHTGNPDYEAVSGVGHSLVPMYKHPLWEGRITDIRIALAPGESEAEFAIDSFFTAYDTRHSINNPIYIMACWNAYRWTGDLDFLRNVIGNMRQALRYQQTVMNALELNRIRNEWVGHGGLPGLTVNEDGTKELHYGRGIGNNYWDLLPFGWDDMYSTAQYYTSALIMAELEAAIQRHPEWEIPGSGTPFDPAALRAHAAQVKETANELFWNPETERFVASIDKEGTARDYGFTFVNLDAIWYGIASTEHAEAIMDWITGERIVEGDTSQGDDIYRWRFGPRATTLRNVDWYGQGWTAPEHIPFGGQIQDGGAVLGFSFYDLWARLQVLGPGNAWDRLQEILAWERDVWSEGGYRPYYEDGKRGTTLQGGGTAGGLGIDHEFWESSLLPSIIIYGFLGLEPNATDLVIRPKLPADCPELGVSDLRYRETALDVLAGPGYIEVAIKEKPAKPLQIDLEGDWKLRYTDYEGSRFALHEPGTYRFER